MISASMLRYRGITQNLNINHLYSLYEVMKMGALFFLGIVLIVVGLILMKQSRRVGRPAIGLRGIAEDVWYDYLPLITAFYGLYLFITQDPTGIIDEIKSWLSPLIGGGVLGWFLKMQLEPLKTDLKNLTTRVNTLDERLYEHVKDHSVKQN